MPVVDKNQLKIWFKNLAKPVQEQFWNWMDSFYHKSEPIPKSAVENLTTDLAKKADLFGGVVPASQLPFSVNTSEVIAVGEISATENTVTLAVHSSGTNAVRINGVVLTRTFPNTFNFTPVTEGSKFLIIYAINDSGIFRIAEGVEDLEAVEPEIPVGALFIRRILVNPNGVSIEFPESSNLLKYTSEDTWKRYYFTEPNIAKFLSFSNDNKSSYFIEKMTNFSGDLILEGIKIYNGNIWNGKQFTIFNNTNNNLKLVPSNSINLITFNISAPIIISSKKSVQLKLSEDMHKLEIITYDGGAFDLDSKADLVDGKIKREQSQPSTIVMDNANYIITFTDATGAVQTIDLPLESLFKDANYDAATKSLIVTLDNGTTKSIPLTDLVDLPEIVISATNPAVTPTTGQKVWFNTSLGKVWFNVAGVWTYSGNLMTDAEKIKLAKTSGTNTGDETNSTIINKIGYTPENTLNKSSDVLADKASPIKFPTVKAIYDYLQPEFNSRLKSYAYDSVSEFPMAIQPDAFFIDRELGDLYIGWSDPNYFGDPGLPGGTYYKKIGLDINTTDLVYYYKKNESDLRYLPIKANSSTGTLISFTTDKVYGTLATPETGNITADVTNAKLGVTNIIIHNSGTAPTFESAFKKLSGSGNYTTGVVNYIYCTFISATEIIYSINQRT